MLICVSIYKNALNIAIYNVVVYVEKEIEKGMQLAEPMLTQFTDAYMRH